MKDKISQDSIISDIKVTCDACDCNAVFKNEKEAYLNGWNFMAPVEGLIVCFCPACAAEKI